MKLRMWRALLLAAAVCVAAVVPAAASPDEPICTDTSEGALPLSITVSGQEATGFYALPDSQPVGLVTFAHGFGHTSASWVEHIRLTAAQYDVIALAMDYRGTVITPRDGDVPRGEGWQVREGAEDTVAAAQQFERDCPGISTIVNFGVSMGGNASGLAAAAGADRADGSPLFDHWVDVEGATNVIETYLSARALARSGNATAVEAVQAIEREMGGPIESRSAVYADHAVVTRTDDIAASGVRSVSVIHGTDDGLVPPNQSRELVTLLRDDGVATSMFQVTLRDAQTERDTTITGYATGPVAPDFVSPLAGHASERSTTHLVMRTAFDRLGQLLRGTAVICDGEYHMASGGSSGGCLP